MKRSGKKRAKPSEIFAALTEGDEKENTKGQSTRTKGRKRKVKVCKSLDFFTLHHFRFRYSQNFWTFNLKMF